MSVQELPGYEAGFIHGIDDGEKARTVVLRGALNAIALLTDGLHALRHGSPEITDEFIDRSITHLTKAVASCRELVASDDL